MSGCAAYQPLKPLERIRPTSKCRCARSGVIGVAPAGNFTNAPWAPFIGSPQAGDIMTPCDSGISVHFISSADIIVVLGDDLADAPWEDRTGPLVDLATGVGALLVFDATTTAAGHELVQQRIAVMDAARELLIQR